MVMHKIAVQNVSIEAVSSFPHVPGVSYSANMALQ